MLWFRSCVSAVRALGKGFKLPRNLARTYSDGTLSREELMKKYAQTKKACEDDALLPIINPYGVFANNELDLSEITVYGFDYDYTLAVYKESLHYLIYELGRQWLIEKYKYPEGIKDLEYIPGFAIRGLHFDMQEGLLMKLDSFHQMQFESIYRGLEPISKDEITSIYGGSYIPQEMIRGQPNEASRMKQLNDLFSVPEICLLSNVMQYFVDNKIMYHPEILSTDVQNAVQSIHPIMHKQLNEDNIDEYIDKQSSLPELLNRLKEKEKKMFLITNSPFKFVDLGMRFMIGPDWMDLFEVIVAQARKPRFFTDKHRPFRLYDIPTKSQLWERVTHLEKGKVYIEGNLKDLQEMTGWYGSSVLYFGDQIYSDLADLTLNHGWRTGAIIYELTNEIEIMNTEEFRHEVGWLQSLQYLIEEMQKYDEEGHVTKNLLVERDELRALTKQKFNKQFGSIFRTHHNPTYFSRRLFRYSDIYMSNVTNLLNYSVNHTFYPRRGVLPHECRIPHI